MFFYSALVVSFALGGFAGITIEKFDKIDNEQSLEIVPNQAETVPVIYFDKIENGVMYGKTGTKEARIIVADDEINTINNGEFNFSVLKILPMLQVLPAPEGMQFAASSKGTRYWPLDAPQAFLLAEQNRVFFASEEEAQNAGYLRGE